MLLLLLLIPAVLSGAAGCLVFMICSGFRRSRRFALSAALAFGTFGAAWSGFALAVCLLITRLPAMTPLKLARMDTFAMHHLMGCMAAAAVPAFFVAALAFVLHQAITARVTLALFRLYVTAAAFGIGLYVAAMLGWAAFGAWNGAVALATILLGSAAISVPLALQAFRIAAQFRDGYTARFNPVSAAEYTSL